MSWFLDEVSEVLERRVLAYLEMHPVILAMALNKHHHALTNGANLQSIHFDRKALVEALFRHSKSNSIDTSAIFRDDIDLHSEGWHRVSWGEGPFKLINVGNSNQAIIPIEDDCDGV
jgi:hypothetical protein